MVAAASPSKLSALWGRIRPDLSFYAVLLLALATRLYRLTWPSLWTDEGFSMGLARAGVPDLFLGTAHDLHPPLFYLLLKVWILPGWSEWYVRLFPALWGVAIVVLGYWIGRRFLGRAVGTWAAFYLALSPIQQYYGRQLRMYLMLVFLVGLSTYLCWRWVTERRPWTWSGYILATLAALYTQNVGLFILPVENLLVLAAVIAGRRWRLLLPWIVAQLLIVIGFMPWVPILLHQAAAQATTWIHRATAQDLHTFFPFVLFGQPYLPANADLWRTAAYTWLGAVLGQAAVVYLARGRPERRSGAFLWGWFLLLTAVTFAAVSIWPIFQEKQLLVLSVPLALLAGMGTASLPRSGRVAAALAFLALAWPGLRYVYTQEVFQDWRNLAAYMQSHAQPDDVVIVNPGAIQPTLDLYLEMPLRRIGYPLDYTPAVGNTAGEKATWEILEARFGPALRGVRRAWLIECSLPEYWDPQRLIPTWLREWGEPVPLPSFAGIEVRLYVAQGGRPD